MPDPRCVIVSAMRDEAPYILEWIAYHRAIGVTDFLIYTNDCRDGTDLLLDRLQHNGIVTHVRNKVLKRGPQKSAFKAAQSHPLYEQADWVLASDVDEFLNIKVGTGHILDLLARFPNTDAIPICWRLFSHNGQERFITGLTLEALTDAESADAEPEGVGRFVKSLFKPNPAIERIGTHAPVYSKAFEKKAVWGASWCEGNPDEDPRRPKADYGYDIAQMNHYAVRAIEPFLMKRDRGDANYMANRLEVEYWARWCRGGSKETSILRNLPSLKEELEQLLSDPVVRHLHLGAVAFHKDRIAGLLKLREYQNIKEQIFEHSRPSASRISEPAQVDKTPATKFDMVYTSQHLANTAAAELVAKAPGRHNNRLKMLERLPKNGRGAEIGVWNGGFSEFILKVTRPKELTLIDPWDLLSDQSEDERTHKKHADANFMEDMFLNVTKLYGQMENVKIVKGFSADVLSDFPDNYFDWVYIDGNHQYDFVKKDVEIAFRKVRSGGTIAGDDFFWKRNDRMHVKEAVLDAMRAHGMKNRPNRFGQQFMITVP
ncbi:MAG: glycosyltransferase family 2 protein [Pseudomonadota bacterium]